MRLPEYRVIARESGSLFAPGPVIAEFEQAKNIGYGEYLNDVGEAFFTLTQGDPKASLITDALIEEGLHIEFRRDDDKVWGGWVGEVDENETDAIFYSYSYAAALFWLHTDWNQTWAGAQINTIASDLWDRAKTGLADSGLAWVTTGTIEAPVTTSGGGTPIVLPDYSANYKRILFALQELAGMATSDTTNRVVFEITPGGTFNFWKNLGITRTHKALDYGGTVLGYQRIRTPMDRRNVLLGVGSAPHDIVLRKTTEDSADRSTNSRREEALYYSWIRDEEEIDRVNRLRLSQALRTDNMLALSTRPGEIIPARSGNADYALGDYITVRIDNGITQLNEPKLITGQQVVWTRGVERVRPIVQDRL
jgi:hypothetical protein